MRDLCPFDLSGRRSHNDQDGFRVASDLRHMIEVLTLAELIAKEVFGRVWDGLRGALELREDHGLLLKGRLRRTDQLGVNTPLVLADQLHRATCRRSNTRHVSLLKLLHHVRHRQRINSFDVACARFSDPARVNQLHHWQPPA